MAGIKVLLLLYGVEAAGAEKVALSIAKNIDKGKFKPVVCALRGGRLLNEFLALNIPVYILGKKRGVDFSIIWKLLRILKTEEIKIIHSHNFSPNFWGRVVGRIARTPVLIITEHTIATAKTRLSKIIDFILSKITDKIIAVSNRVRDSHIKEEKIDHEKLITIYNGIESWNYDNKILGIYKKQFLKELGISSENYLITTIGRLEAPKGHENLLKAIPMVLKAYPKVCFLMVGDGRLKPELETLAERLSVKENVFFVGYRTDVRNILAISDLCIIPSIREGFSITLLEAMSVGKPIVATDVGGNSEAIIDGESGIIVQPGDPNALANGIITVHKNKILGEEMGIKARKRFEEFFTIQKMIDETEKLYESFCYKIR